MIAFVLCTTSTPSLLHIQVDFDKSGSVDLTECYAMVLNVYLKIAIWVTLCKYSSSNVWFRKA